MLAERSEHVCGTLKVEELMFMSMSILFVSVVKLRVIREAAILLRYFAEVF